MSEEPIILIEGLSVRYGALEAVRELSLTVRRGEVFGLLGPNGAGKSSILSCVEGLRRPSAGRVLVGGHDLAQRPQAAKAWSCSPLSAASTRARASCSPASPPA